MNAFARLRESWQGLCDPRLLVHTRAHLLRHQPVEGARLWVKREDETGKGISGYKWRKYASLLPWLEKEKFQQAVLIGSSNSGNVAALSSLLLAHEIQPVAFLRKNRGGVTGTNEQIIRQHIPAENLYELNAEEWPRAEQLAAAFANESYARGIKSAVIPEGAKMREAVPGLFSLYDSILENESVNAQPFTHIFTDSGTGLTSAALALCMELDKHPARLHVVLMAGTQAEFAATFHQTAEWTNELFHLPGLPEFHLPETAFPSNAKAFGSVNATLLKFQQQWEARENMKTDAVYSAKLFEEAIRICTDRQLKGDILLIHSGLSELI